MMDFLSNLQETTDIWISGRNTDEWLFERFRESHVETLESPEAFSLIDSVVTLLLAKANIDAWVEIFETLLALVRKSHTTEVPPGLLTELREIKVRSSLMGTYELSKFEELNGYYRIKV